MRSVFLLISSVLMLHMSALAQDCKGVKTVIDKFSKKETKTGTLTLGKIKMVSFTGSTKWLLTIKQDEGKTYIETSIASAGEVNQALDENTIFNILMDNGEVIKLFNKGTAKPVTQAYASNGRVNVYTTFLLVLEPTIDELKSLSNGSITDVKVEIPNLKIQSPEISSKDANNFKNVISCMLATAK